ncbi:uncharacterized protein AB675_2327 [Cyphellophora attinorum]|uniref:G domain-containing protein n=1 Tax=Cyphellophora attinorum TaxID=1664694 RepID=A0A0N1HXN6_9EURO|nr:uncharacterized protein AB675_2327 [Phialophora attinorum]KPI45356.1 hypothetical protein AB675_2327 [Phialophora attinorum]
MTKSQHLAYCATAKHDSWQYTQACIKGVWGSLYGRTAAPEDEQVTSIAVPVSVASETVAVPTTLATMVRAKVSVEVEVPADGVDADEADDASSEVGLEKRGFWDLFAKIGNIFNKKGDKSSIASADSSEPAEHDDSQHVNDVIISDNQKFAARYQRQYQKVVDSGVVPQPPARARTSSPLQIEAAVRRRHRHGLEDKDTLRRPTSYVAPTAPIRGSRHSPDDSPVSTPGSSRPPSPHVGGKLKILVVGGTGVGKSTLISQLCKTSKRGPKIGHTLMSCTSDIQSFDCTLDGVDFELIDSAGFDDNRMSDEEVLQRLARYLRSNPGIHGVIFCHRISDTRLTGSAAKTAQIIHELCGPAFQDRIALVTTMWDRVRDTKVAERREDELLQHPRFWRPFHQHRDRPVQPFRFSLSGEGPVHSAEDIARFFVGQQKRFFEKPVELQLAAEMKQQRLLSETAAGALLKTSELPLRATRSRHS